MILAVQSGRDSIGETAAAALAMRQIDTPLLGAVLLPNVLGPMNTVPLPGARREGPPEPQVSEDETPTDSLEPVEETTQVIPAVRSSAEPR